MRKNVVGLFECPFCRRLEGMFSQDVYSIHVRCDSCGAYAPVCNTRADAKRKWNDWLSTPQTKERDDG